MSPQRLPQRFTHAGSTFSASTLFKSALSASVAFTSTIGVSFAGEPILQDGRLALQSIPSWVNSTPPNCHCLSVSSLKLSSRKRRTSGASLKELTDKQWQYGGVEFTQDGIDCN